MDEKMSRWNYGVLKDRLSYGRIRAAETLALSALALDFNGVRAAGERHTRILQKCAMEILLLDLREAGVPVPQDYESRIEELLGPSGWATASVEEMDLVPGAGLS